MLFFSRQQIVIFCSAVVMVGGFFLFRYLPLQKRIKAVEQAGASQELTIAEVSAKSERLPMLKEQLLELQRKVGNYEASIPAKRELGGFLNKTTDLMNENNLKEQLVQPGKEIELQELSCIPLSIRCKGRLAEIFDFYKQLQGLDRAVRIEQVKLVNDGSFSGEVSMQTKAIIYYRPAAGQS